MKKLVDHGKYWLTDEHADFYGIIKKVDVITGEIVDEEETEDLPELPRFKIKPLLIKDIKASQTFAPTLDNDLDGWIDKHHFTHQDAADKLGLSLNGLRHQLKGRRKLGRQTLIIMNLIDELRKDV